MDITKKRKRCPNDHVLTYQAALTAIPQKKGYNLCFCKGYGYIYGNHGNAPKENPVPV